MYFHLINGKNRIILGRAIEGEKFVFFTNFLEYMKNIKPSLYSGGYEDVWQFYLKGKLGKGGVLKEFRKAHLISWLKYMVEDLRFVLKQSENYNDKVTTHISLEEFFMEVGAHREGEVSDRASITDDEKNPLYIMNLFDYVFPNGLTAAYCN